MTDSPMPRYRYWGSHKPVALARPVETVQMAAAGVKPTAQIRLYGPIDSWGAPFGVAATEVAAALDSVGNADVELHVHSPGGDAFEGLAIMNLLRQHEGDVSLVVDGLAASAASIVAMGADTVTMAPGAQMMIHDAAALAIGQADDMRQAADMLDSISSNAADQYATKTGASSDDMRAAMKATTWYKAQQAVDAGLADSVLSPDDDQTKAAQTAAASLRFDLSMFDRASAADATHETPADQPVTPPTDHKEADTMSDTIPTAGLVKALGLPANADEDTILEAVEAKVTASAATTPPETGSVDVKAVAAALEADGKIVVTKARLDALEAQAAEGAQARAKQISDERDELIEAAMSAGKITRDDRTREVWAREFGRDFATAKADLESLPARFPVGTAPGVPGNQNDASAEWTDDEADMLAGLAGLPKGALR